MKLFQHKSLPLKLVVLVSSAGLFVLGGTQLFQELRGPMDVLSFLFPILLLMWAVALVRMTAWAGTLVAALLLGFAIFAPIGLTMSNRTELLQSPGDGLSLTEGLLIAVPIVVANMFAVHILGKYRDDFTRRWI